MFGQQVDKREPKAMNLPNIKKPCTNCPFRKDTTKGWLSSDRMKQYLSSGSFTCHKTEAPRLQCAGHMIIKGINNDFVRLASNLGIDPQLRGHSLIFKTESECIKHHEN